jgi:hypothetical protein
MCVYPDFDEQLNRLMVRETETFFRHLVREDRPVGELFPPTTPFVDARLARHYGIPNVIGNQFRKVPYPDGRRQGLLGHGSILTLTARRPHVTGASRQVGDGSAARTPPPPPPPNVPDLDATAEAEDGRLRTVRERLEQHRANPACASCHRMIDPIGLALENFDVTGAWRIKDNGAPVDAASMLYDGTPLTGPADLHQALLKRSRVLVQVFTENLMTFALGRRLGDDDMPAVRAVVAVPGEDARPSASCRRSPRPPRSE